MKHTVQGLSMGSVLINSWLAIALSGIMLLQAYTYWRERPQKDNHIFGLLVIVLLVLDMGHVICIMTTLYHYLIRSFGNNEELLVLVPSLALTVGLTGTITFFAQSFFTWRVWKLSRKNFIPPIIFAFQLARLISGWVTTTKAIKFGTFEAWTHQVRWIFTAGVAIAVLTDILITGSLCYWLHGSRTGAHGMDEIIDRIILYTVENGALICIASIASLICAIIMPGNLVFIGIHFVISKLYINAVLASLNTRNALRARKERLFINAQTGREDRTESTLNNAYSLRSTKSPIRGPSFHSPSGSDQSIREPEDAKLPMPIGFMLREEDAA